MGIIGNSAAEVNPTYPFLLKMRERGCGKPWNPLTRGRKTAFLFTRTCLCEINSEGRALAWLAFD